MCNFHPLEAVCLVSRSCRAHVIPVSYSCTCHARVRLVSRGISVVFVFIGIYIVPFDMKGCVCHFESGCYILSYPRRDNYILCERRDDHKLFMNIHD